MKIMLDSSAIIEYMRNNGNVITLVDESEDISISSISMYEVMVGIKAVQKKEASKFFKEFPLMPFTGRDSARAISLHEELSGSGRLINLVDILLAAQALERGLIIVTKDADFENVRGLSVSLIK